MHTLGMDAYFAYLVIFTHGCVKLLGHKRCFAQILGLGVYMLQTWMNLMDTAKAW